MEIKELLEDYKNEILETNKLIFNDVDSKDVYNISQPVFFKGKELIFGRVEPRDSSELSKVVLFEKKKGEFYVDKTFDILNDSEDPFITKIGEEFVLGVVEVVRIDTPYPFDPDNFLKYKTVFFKGKDLYNLKRFFESPWVMKDIRLLELPDKRILVFTRPQGFGLGRGKIGFNIINSLADLNEKVLNGAEIIENQFFNEEWGGVNQAHFLKNGKIGVLGHIAKKNPDKSKEYYALAFCFDLEKKEITKPKIIFKREDISKGDSKNSQLYEVVFPGGLLFQGKEDVKVYTGVGDAESYEVLMKNPFLGYF